MSNNKKDKVDLFDNLKLTKDNCFICGDELNSSNKTQEHVFPQWLLHKFDLWDHTLTLLNDTPIEYFQIKIPCCKTCNTGKLSDIERHVSSVVTKGFSHLNEIDDLTLVSWMLKISLGIQYKEMYLKNDRSDKKSASITDEDWLQKLKITTTIMRSVYEGIKMIGKSWSLLKFHLKNVQEKDNFDFQDLVYQNTIIMRMNDIGLVLIYDDANITEKYFLNYEPHKNIYKRSINIIEYYEVATILTYTWTLFEYIPKYMLIKNKNSDKVNTLITMQIPSYVPLTYQWNDREFNILFSKVLGAYGIRYEDLLDFDSGKRLSFVKELL